MSDIHSTTPGGAAGIRLKQAYDRHEQTFKAMSAAELKPIVVDISRMYPRILAKLQQLGPLREQVLTVSHLNVPMLLLVEDYLLALGHAHAQYCTRSLAHSDLPATFAKLLATRTKLSAEFEVLVRRGLLPGERRVATKWPASRARIGFDVLGIVSSLRSHWAHIQGKTGLSETELDEADALADCLLNALGERNGDAMAEAIHMRRAAFVMFARAYDELRRGVSHLRWHERDLERLLPTLYGKRKGLKRAKGKTNREEPKSDAPVSTTYSDKASPAISPGDDELWSDG